MHFVLHFLVVFTVVENVGLGQEKSSTSQSQTEREWPYEAKVDQFLLHSDFELDDQARLESILGGLRSDITQALNLPPQKSSIHVVLFANAKEYARYMGHYFPSIAPRRAIYLQDRGPGMLFTFWHDDIDSDLRHEASHAVLNQSGVQLPLWLDEGLAEYFELPKEKRFNQNGYVSDVAQRAAQGLVPSLMNLEKISNMSNFTDGHYRDSWAWIHFLLHRRQETRQLLIDYVARHRRQAPQMLISKQLGEICSDPAKEFQEHFAKMTTAPTVVKAASFER
ncbi:MAG: DUF1570 domain-containing protein [Pirellulales bacterium]